MLGGNASRDGGGLVVRTSVGPMVLGALFSAFAVALGAYLCAAALGLVAVADPPASAPARLLFLASGASPRAPRRGRLAAGASDLLFFGFCLAFYLGRIVRFRRPIFEVCAEGILDRASALGAGFVPWGEVEGAWMRSFLGQRLLAVEVTDERPLLARQGPVKHLLMGVNGRIVGTPVLVPLGFLNVREDTLLWEIEKHLSRSRGAGGPGRVE